MTKIEREINVSVASMHILKANVDFRDEANVLKHDIPLHLHCVFLSGNRQNKYKVFCVSI